jgi:hypothetical protein
MANIVLYNTGVDRGLSRNPLNNVYYDPWTNHIWYCIEQIRKWNPTTPIYMITDGNEIPNYENFARFNVIHEKTDELPTRYDIKSVSYMSEHKDPISRHGTIRTFYIEEVMRKHGLKDVLTFDNDILVYFEADRVVSIMSSLFKRTAITADSYYKVVFGMCYIKDCDALSVINDMVWKVISTPNCQMYDMQIWHYLLKQMGSDYIAYIPTWVNGDFSDHNKILGGIFDPSSIGQHFLGDNSGTPKGCLFPDHYIHQRLKEGCWGFYQEYDSNGRRFFSVFNKNTGEKTKIMSIHVHCKKLRELM